MRDSNNFTVTVLEQASMLLVGIKKVVPRFITCQCYTYMGVLSFSALLHGHMAWYALIPIFISHCQEFVCVFCVCGINREQPKYLYAS